MKQTTLQRFGALLLLTTVLSGCGAQQATLDSLSIGFSTPRGNKIWIRDAIFDGTWGVPGGIITCCWKEAGGGSSLFNQPMPGSVLVRWGDVSRGVIYEAQTDLPDDLTEQALALPPITLEMNGRTYYDPGLIIGLRDNGAMVVWLANSTSGKNVKNFVLKVVARDEGHIVGEIPSEQGKTSGR